MRSSSGRPPRSRRVRPALERATGISRIRSPAQAPGRHATSRDPSAESGGGQGPGPDGSESLSWPQRRFLLRLGLPSLALALAITLVTTYLPVFIAELTGPALTGVLIGSEGLLALFVPLLVGARSDSARTTRFGRRKPFLIGAVPVAALALILMPLTTSLVILVILLLVFYAAYFTYYAPYRALYPDLVPDEQRGRSQGFQGTMREIGLGGALVGGGLLLGLWRPLPFVVGAVVLLAVTAVFVRTVREPREVDQARESTESWIRSARSVLRERNGLPWLVLGTGMWEFALGALKTFVVLFLTVGLGRSMSFSSLVLAIVASAVIAAAITSGKLADRFGHGRLIHAALWVYGLGVLVPFFVQSPVALAAVPVAAFAAGVVMTLPFSMLMGLMPESGHGAASGLFELSRGVGVLLGPAAAGVAIHLLAPTLESTDGYAAVFPVAAAAILLSIPVFRRVERAAPAT